MSQQASEKGGNNYEPDARRSTQDEHYQAKIADLIEEIRILKSRDDSFFNSRSLFILIFAVLIVSAPLIIGLSLQFSSRVDKIKDDLSLMNMEISQSSSLLDERAGAVINDVINQVERSTQFVEIYADNLARVHSRFEVELGRIADRVLEIDQRLSKIEGIMVTSPNRTGVVPERKDKTQLPNDSE